MRQGSVELRAEAGPEEVALFFFSLFSLADHFRFLSRLFHFFPLHVMFSCMVSSISYVPFFPHLHCLFFAAGCKAEDTIKTDLYVYGASDGAWFGPGFTQDINITTSELALASSWGNWLAYTTRSRLLRPIGRNVCLCSVKTLSNCIVGLGEDYVLYGTMFFCSLRYHGSFVSWRR